MNLLKISGLARIIPMVVATVALGTSATAPAAASKVVIVLGGKSFGHGKSLNLTSSPWKISPSKLYTYKIKGTCSGIAPKKLPPGTLTLADLVPAGTSLDKLLNTISPGSSKFLKGTFPNPTGKLPVVVLDRKISGSEVYPGIGKVSLSLKITATILQSGEIAVDITNIKMKTASGKIPGKIRFGKGSKATYTTAPVVQFQTRNQQVDEAAGTVDVVITRFGNQKGNATVGYTTSDLTAQAGVHYTETSGQVKFLNKQTKKTISIPIINNSEADGYRKFKVTLLNPGTGVILGKRTNDTIGILEDD